MIATVQTIREIVELTAQRLQPAGIVFLEAVLAIKQVERRSLFCAGLGYQKGSAGKIECSELLPAFEGYRLFSPLQPSGHH